MDAILIGTPLTEKVLQHPTLVQASAIDEGDNLASISRRENGRKNAIESKLENGRKNPIESKLENGGKNPKTCCRRKKVRPARPGRRGEEVLLNR